MSQKSDEEEPFRKIRLTLSEDALDMLRVLKKEGAFRSDSATVEECIRSMYDITDDVSLQLQSAKDQNRKLNLTEQSDSFRRLVMRVRRFLREPKKKRE